MPQRPDETAAQYRKRLLHNKRALERMNAKKERDQQDWARIAQLMGHSPPQPFTRTTFTEFVMSELPVLLDQLKQTEMRIKQLKNKHL